MPKRNAELAKMAQRLDDIEAHLGASAERRIADAEQAAVAQHACAILDRAAALRSGGHESFHPQPPDPQQIAGRILSTIDFSYGMSDNLSELGIDGIATLNKRMDQTRQRLCEDPAFRCRVLRRLYATIGPTVARSLALTLLDALGVRTRHKPSPSPPRAHDESVTVPPPDVPSTEVEQAKPVEAFLPSLGPKMRKRTTLVDFTRRL